MMTIGVLGCASIAKRYVIPAIKESKYWELAGISSRNEPKANAFAKDFTTKAFYSYQSLLDDKSIKAVYIPLPNSLHFKWVKKALQLGKHVLVEKSMACTYAEVEELNKIAKNNQLALVENFQFRTHSQLQFIKDIIASGTLGELRQVRSSFGFPPFPDKSNIRYDKALGGGALLDAGAYPLKIAQILLGKDITVTSASLDIPEKYNVDIWGSAFLKQNNSSLTAQISFGFDHYYQNSLEIWGSLGKLSTNRIFTAPPGYEPNIVIETASGSETKKLPSDHHFINMLDHFYNIASNKNKLEEEYQQNINQARLLEELKTTAHGQ